MTVFPAMTRGVVVVLFSWTVACGDATSAAFPEGDGSTDAGSDQAAEGDAASIDAGTLGCGDALCSPSEICLTPAYGCVAAAPLDAGVCPVGTEYSDASGGCLQSPPPPSCVSPVPGTGSFDCSGGDAGANCEVVNAPIPSRCSRVCRAICA